MDSGGLSEIEEEETRRESRDESIPSPVSDWIAEVAKNAGLDSRVEDIVKRESMSSGGSAFFDSSASNSAQPEYHNGKDRNFDDLADRFASNVYGTMKGRLRLDVVLDDLRTHLPGLFNRPTPRSGSDSSDADVPFRRLLIVDAGGGQGQLSAMFAAAGHRVVLCDISSVMIERAREEFKKVASEGEKSGHEIIPPVFLHCAAQDLITQPQNTKDAKELSGDMCSPRETELDEKLRQLELLDPRTGEGRVDLVLFHAVIEWAADPFASLNALEKLLRPPNTSCGHQGGHLSCLYYNKPALVWRHLMNGSFDRADNPTGVLNTSNDFREANSSGKVKASRKKRRGGGRVGAYLTPERPQDTPTVLSWLGRKPEYKLVDGPHADQHLEMEILAHSGIRAVHDHMYDGARKKLQSYEALLSAELKWGRLSPYRDLARYVHVLARKSRSNIPRQESKQTRHGNDGKQRRKMLPLLQSDEIREVREETRGRQICGTSGPLNPHSDRVSFAGTLRQLLLDKSNWIFAAAAFAAATAVVVVETRRTRIRRIPIELARRLILNTGLNVRAAGGNGVTL